MQGYLTRMILLGTSWSIALILLLGGAVFLIIALYLQLSTALSSAGAASVTGLIALLGACAFIWLTFWNFRRSRRSPSSAGQDQELGTERVQEALAAEAGMALARFLSQNKRYSSRLAVIALLGGFVVGVSPRARRRLRELIR